MMVKSMHLSIKQGQHGVMVEPQGGVVGCC